MRGFDRIMCYVWYFVHGAVPLQYYEWLAVGSDMDVTTGGVRLARARICGRHGVLPASRWLLRPGLRTIDSIRAMRTKELLHGVDEIVATQSTLLSKSPQAKHKDKR